MDSTASTSLVSSNLKPPKLEKNDRTGKCWKAAICDNWKSDLRDALKVGDLNAESEDAMIWLGWQLEGDAKILHVLFIHNPATSQFVIGDFLKAYRKYCIPFTNKDTVWMEFQAIRQLENGRTKPIQRVGNRIKQVQILLTKISDWRCYNQLLEALDNGLLNKVRVQINNDIEWSDIIRLCEIHDSIQHKFRSGNRCHKPKNAQKSQ